MSLETYVLHVLPWLLPAVSLFMLVLNRLLTRAARRSERRAIVLAVVQAQQPNGTGYTLTQEVARRTGKFAPLVEIYSHLAELQRIGAVSSRWGVAEQPNGPRPRHYWITADHLDLAHEGGRG